MTTVLDELVLLPGWSEVPFRSVAEKVSESGFPDLESLSVFLDAGVVPRASREDNHNQLGESLDKYQRVLPNDLVFNKLRTWQGGFGISNYEGIVSPAYIIARPNQSLIEPRFLGYLMKSKPYLAELTRLSKWMPPTQFDISWESIRDLKLRIPPVEEQRLIADYLDTQRMKIDVLIALRREQIALNKSLIFSYLSDLISPDQDQIPLKRLAHISVSNVDKHTVDGDLPVFLCNYVDVYKNREITADLDFMPATASVEQVKRFKVRLHDILFTKDSETADDIAQCAYAVQEIPNLVLGYHCGILRAFAINSEYLYWAMQSPYVANQFSVAATGVTRVGLKLDDIGIVMIPTPNSQSQSEIVNKLKHFIEKTEQLNKIAEAQVLLLNELRTSLITSAVTGTIDVTDGRSVA